jgi:hypothetical protein
VANTRVALRQRVMILRQLAACVSADGLRHLTSRFLEETTEGGAEEDDRRCRRLMVSGGRQRN